MLKAAAVSLAAWAGAPALAALPTLNCTLLEGGETISASFTATGEPYAVPAVQTRHFRIKAVISENDAASALVKVYAYYKRGGQYSLMHLEKYLVSLDAGQAPTPLRRGMHYLYSPVLGRELAYECNAGASGRGTP